MGDYVPRNGTPTRSEESPQSIIDCIQFKAILQCNQKKYQLTGQAAASALLISNEP
ncbi:hypothetical protein BKA56DRAFT_579362 [Ilyonectria sp. MPI-CAGE-AT-0026]|nr:hypothetical protein BKA56DRAFT_579362 [Ilyonectria sp. MPI-CAGE-AT-0026]